ncbi:sulfur oxidation c-type cytochrome SoxA [Pseudoduganella sp. HUAS MS19]
MKPAFALLLALITATAASADRVRPYGSDPGLPVSERKSGTEYMSLATQSMQRDDTQNPAMLWVANGQTLWNTVPVGGNGKSCATCHGDAKTSMRGAATKFPRFSKAAGKVITLSGQINQCRTSAQQAEPLKPESPDLLALETYTALQSRGMPLARATDEQTRQSAARGQKLFTTRIGQLNLSCAQCHDHNAGKRLAGAPIPQGHANAYPIYRLEWQGAGSLQRRLRNCMSGVRAEVPPYGAPDLVDLEAYLAQRAQGMPLETPGVRP